MKKVAIIFAVIIVILLGVLIFVPSSKAPEAPPAGTGADGTNASSTAPSSTPQPQPAVSSDGRVIVASPRPGDTITSPVTITGTVTGGGWFFEASFPATVIDADGTVLGRGQARAQGDWMTTGTVSFSAMVAFVPPRSATGRIVLAKDNPSGAPQNDLALSVPVAFAKAQPTGGGNATTTGGGAGTGGVAVSGHVLLGPTCPVERIPPDPACAPRPYQTKIDIYIPVGSPLPYRTISSNASGTFSAMLAPGTYFFQPRGGSAGLPRCPGSNVTVPAGGLNNITLDCDTGIR